MANRAYLYSTDCGALEKPEYQKWVYANADDRRLYDSRWTIPWAWFFLFQVPEVTIVEVQFPSGFVSTQVRFLAQRSTALSFFADKLPLIRQIAGPGFHSDKVLGGFRQKIHAWNGRYLALDPSEILVDEEEEDLTHCIGILKRIAEPGANALSIAAALRRYSSLDYEDQRDFEVKVVGVTYW